ncbi:hypothetical protein J4476_05820 [Candidatus Woesearchaeota archaeon]|nr:hypothetical protein [Candidatus Woesearchaeota archaeon]
MEIKYSNSGITILNKELSSLDKLTILFISILDRLQIEYVLVSGYVSILFGRNRNSEDIDIIIKKLDFKKFEQLFLEFTKEFYCINSDNIKELYEEYLCSENSIRFSIEKTFIPNIEVKFPQTSLDILSLKERIRVNINNKFYIFISPLELQVSFKLYLGSEKDIEDAKYLYEIFKEKLDHKLLLDFCRKLKIEGDLYKYLK